MVNILGMDATQFQAAVLAWGAAVTTLIAVLVGIALAVRSAITQITKQSVDNTAAIAAVTVKTDAHEKALNGDLSLRVAPIVDGLISQHRRVTDSGPSAVQ